tara:strand:+ start:615 stop:2018 length:1404 start_codon:yes stop_codon:yes gene_type:complete
MFNINKLRKYKNRIAIVDQNNETLSYSDLLIFVKILSKKIKTKSLIFLVCGNNLESIIGYISSVSTNSTMVLIDEKIKNIHLQELIKTYKPEKIFINKSFKKFKSYKNKFCFKNFFLHEREIKTKVKINNNLILLVPTSGSTGSSKYVRISKKNLLNNTESIIKYLNLKKNDVCITTLPMNYVYGLSVLNTHLHVGAKIILNNRSVIEKYFWEAIVSHKVTNFSGVPFTFEILNKINFYNKNLKYLKFLTVAGGRLNNEILRKIIKKFTSKSKRFYVMYGAAEATARMSYLPIKYLKKKIGSIGIPIRGGKFWLENAQGNKILKNNKNGELVYSGKNVSMGYARKLNDLSKADDNKGVLKTGDIAYKDKDGFYYLVGRKDRYIKIHGNRINLSELENNISKLGISSICKFKDGFIKIFVTTIKDKNNIKANLNIISNLHFSVFDFKIIKKLPTNKNYKLSYNDKILK